MGVSPWLNASTLQALKGRDRSTMGEAHRLKGRHILTMGVSPWLNATSLQALKGRDRSTMGEAHGPEKQRIPPIKP